MHLSAEKQSHKALFSSPAWENWSEISGTKDKLTSALSELFVEAVNADSAGCSIILSNQEMT